MEYVGNVVERDDPPVRKDFVRPRVLSDKVRRRYGIIVSLSYLIRSSLFFLVPLCTSYVCRCKHSRVSFLVLVGKGGSLLYGKRNENNQNSGPCHQEVEEPSVTESETV